MRKTFYATALAAMAGISLLSASSALALSIGLDDGSFVGGVPAVNVADEGGGDLLSGQLGAVSMSSGYGSFIINVVTGLNLNTLGGGGGFEHLDLNSVNVSGGAGTIWVLMSEYNLNHVAGWKLDFGGTTNGTVEFFLGRDSANTEWSAISGLASVSPVFTGGAFSGTYSTTGGFLVPYDAVLAARITHTDAFQVTSFDFEANPVPEPATMLLLGTGLAGIAGLSRRKRG